MLKAIKNFLINVSLRSNGLDSIEFKIIGDVLIIQLPKNTLPSVKRQQYATMVSDGFISVKSELGVEKIIVICKE